MTAYFSPFRTLVLICTIGALPLACSIIVDAQLEDKPRSSSTSSGLGGSGNVGPGGSNVGGMAGPGGTGGSDLCAGSCNVGEECCDGICFSTQDDPSHCGSCTNTCSGTDKCCGGSCAECCKKEDCPTLDHTCESGVCKLNCGPPKTVCDQVCTDLDSDSKHCGSCTTDCLSGHDCSGGVCLAGWVEMQVNGALSGRQHAAATWTGSKLFIFGGKDTTGDLGDGALYDPSTDAWTILPTTNAPTARVDAVAVTIGTRVLVWGGGSSMNNIGLNSGKLFDLTTNEWLDVAVAPIGRRAPAAVWTGSRVIFWGGNSGGSAIAGGAMYDPVMNKWTVLANANAPSARSNAAAVWSGSELLIFGGRPSGIGSTNDGYGYDPAAGPTGSWRKLSSVGAPTARFDVFAAWTGSTMVVIGGRDSGTAFADGGAYNPATDTWTTTKVNPLGKRSAPVLRSGWNSSGTSKIILAGGLDETQALEVDGHVYDSSVNDWGAQITTWKSMTEHEYGVGVWTGVELILWSGLDNGSLTSSGDRYRP